MVPVNVPARSLSSIETDMPSRVCAATGTLPVSLMS